MQPRRPLDRVGNDAGKGREGRREASISPPVVVMTNPKPGATGKNPYHMPPSQPPRGKAFTAACCDSTAASVPGRATSAPGVNLLSATAPAPRLSSPVVISAAAFRVMP